LDDGVYRVVVDTDTTDEDFPFPAGLTQVYDPDGVLDDEASDIVISGGEVVSVGGESCSDCANTLNFGYLYFGTNTLSGTIGLDGDPLDGLLNGTNTSGVAADEVPFAGVTVFIYLWNDANENDVIDSGELIWLGTTETNEFGDYSFTGLPDGQPGDRYIVSMVPPIGNVILTTETSTPDHPAELVVPTSNSQGHTTGAYMVVEIDEEITNMDFAFTSAVEYDFDDLPASYGTLLLNNGARHIVPNPDNPTLFLGQGVSTEPDGQPSVNADADTFDDGVSLSGICQHGPNAASVEVEVVGTGWLVAYVDFGNTGNFLGAGDLIINQAVTTGTYIFTFDVPLGTFDDPETTLLYARFRLLPEDPVFAELAFQGEASNGEVEGYRWAFHTVNGSVFADTGTIPGDFDGGDAPLAGVVVGLYDNDNNLLAQTVTQLDGSYRFYGIPDGDYEVRMETPAGGTAIRDADGDANGNDRIEITVSGSPLNDQVVGCRR
jgi:hypothetical protein